MTTFYGETAAAGLREILELARRADAAEAEQVGLDERMVRPDLDDAARSLAMDAAADRAIEAKEALVRALLQADRDGWLSRLIGQLQDRPRPDVEPNPKLSALDAWWDLGEARGFDAANAVLARFLPEPLRHFGGVGDVPAARRPAFAEACRAEMRRSA